MDHKDHDKVFFSNFSLVMAALFGIFFICIVAARILVSHSDIVDDPGAKQRIAERIQPVAKVVTDPNALVAVAAAAPARKALTGEQVYSKLCTGCHAAGVLGAPKTGDKAAWVPRLAAAKDLKGLTAVAIHGLNAMPPKGGDPSLSDQEMEDAVAYLLKQAGL